MKTIPILVIALFGLAAADAIAQPTITAQPKSQSVSLGANVTFSVRASGTAPLSYQWRLNDSVIPGATTNSLALANVQKANAGGYTVVVGDLSGLVVTSQVATLEVDPTFTKITTGDVVAGTGNAWWGDVDNDNYLDLVAFPTNSPPLLYHNNHDRTFSKVAAGLPRLGSANLTTAAFGDFNNDGYLDLLVGQDSSLIWLLQNRGDGTFTNVAKAGALMFGLVNQPSGVGWVDYNNDGWLDLFIPDTSGSQSSVLFQNNGDGTFSPVRSAGLASSGFGVNGCAWADYDNDGYADLFAAAIPGTGNLLYHNNGDGTFTRITDSPVSKDGANHSGGCAWGDYDNDGFPDLFVTNGENGPGARNFLYHNEGNGTFTKVTQGNVVTTVMSAHGGSWGDYDNDGFLDLFINNWNYGNLGTPAKTNALYHNKGDGSFTAVSAGSLTSDVGSFTVSGWADYDNDGFLDLFVANFNGAGSNVLYRNNGNSNSWVKVQCVGTVSNRPGIGAKVRAKAFYLGASRWQLREIFGGDGWGNSQPLLAHFGLGDATNIDTLRIEWPSGVVQEIYDLAPKQFLTITEPAITVPWRKRTVLPGTTVTFVVNSRLTNTLSYQWQLNGGDITGQTNQTFDVASAGLANGGQYRLAIHTSTSLVLSPAANLVVLPQQPHLLPLPLTNGLFTVQVDVGVSPGLMIEASTNLADWLPIVTNRTTNVPFMFLDAKTGLFPWRFYRTITP